MNKQSLLPKVEGRKCQNNIGNGAGYMKCSLSKKTCPYQRFCTHKKIFECTASEKECPNFKLRK